MNNICNIKIIQQNRDQINPNFQQNRDQINPYFQQNRDQINPYFQQSVSLKLV